MLLIDTTDTILLVRPEVSFIDFRESVLTPKILDLK